VVLAGKGLNGKTELTNGLEHINAHTVEGGAGRDLEAAVLAGDGGAFLATQFNSNLILTSEAQIYYDYFINVEVDGIDIHAAIKENLNKAWEAADDKTKEYIRPHYEAFSDWTRFLE
jgi:hypothetical protein